MKITIYDLLGMIKDGKAPKKIKVTGTIYDFDEEYGFYFTKTKNGKVALGGKRNEINLIYNFNNENNVEIIEDKIEEEKKIPEKLKILNANEHSKKVYYKNYSKEEIVLDIKTLQNWVNGIIDYLKSKGE